MHVYFLLTCIESRWIQLGSEAVLDGTGARFLWYGGVGEHGQEGEVLDPLLLLLLSVSVQLQGLSRL